SKAREAEGVSTDRKSLSHVATIVKNSNWKLTELKNELSELESQIILYRAKVFLMRPMKVRLLMSGSPESVTLVMYEKGGDATQGKLPLSPKAPKGSSQIKGMEGQNSSNVDSLIDEATEESECKRVYELWLLNNRTNAAITALLSQLAVGIVYVHWAPESQTVTQHYYIEVLTALRERVRRRRPDLWKTKSWKNHQDIAPAHSALSDTHITT
ncbi:hypothetical protein NQ318_019020, partial [Aromia moschata]